MRAAAVYIGHMSSADYNCPIGQCDVPQERRAALEAYRAKRQQWLAWLDTDEHHAIWTTISSMVWADASFRTLTQAAVDGDETCLGNTLLAEQIINDPGACDPQAGRQPCRRDITATADQGRPAQLQALHPRGLP